MPHDANGTPLKVGDHVVIPATILTILPSEEYCNLTVELDHPMPPDNLKTQLSSVNCKQVFLLTPVAVEGAQSGSD